MVHPTPDVRNASAIALANWTSGMETSLDGRQCDGSRAHHAPHYRTREGGKCRRFSTPGPNPRTSAYRFRRSLGGGWEPSGASPSAGGTLGLSYGTLPRGGGCNTSVTADSNTRGGPSVDVARRRDVERIA